MLTLVFRNLGDNHTMIIPYMRKTPSYVKYEIWHHYERDAKTYPPFVGNTVCASNGPKNKEW